MRHRSPARAALVPVLFLAALLMAGGPAAARQDGLQAMHRATLEAMQQGDSAAAMTHARAALDAGRKMADPDPQAFAYALTNLAYLQSLAGEAARATALWIEALAYLDARGEQASEAGFTAMLGLAGHALRQGDPQAARDRLEAALALARDGPHHATVAAAAAGPLLEAGAVQAGVLALNDAARLNPQLLRGSYGALYTRLGTLADRAESEGRAAEAATLIEGKLIIARHFLTGADRDSAIRNLRFQRYFALRGAGDHARARQELLSWLGSTARTGEDQAFLDQMSQAALRLGEGAAIDTLDRIEEARTVIAFARANAATAQDPALARSMRALATAEGYLGQHAAAAQTLSDAIAILQTSAAGRRFLPVFYDHLAWEQVQLGDMDMAGAMFAAADAARGPDSHRAAPVDRAVAAGNRARFHLDSGAPGLARHWLARAGADLDRAGTGADPWPVAAQRVRLLNLDALAAIDTGDDPPLPALLAALDAARALAPPASPDFALMLANAADTALVAGDFATGRALLHEAVEINRTALPDIAPQALDTLAKLGQLELVEGNRAAATDLYRRVTEARKSPLYRDGLGAASWDFEVMAWLLLDAPRPDTDAAFAALQWTQTTRSAAALDALETSLGANDPARGALLRKRRALTEEQAAVLAQLSAAMAAVPADPDLAAKLNARLAQLGTDLSGTEATLNALGLETAGIGRVEPLDLARVQALLAPDEALVTFLLPSLNPQVIAGLDGSSNHVIAITRAAVHVARIPEISRRNLRSRIAAFRCEMAIGDPGCGSGGAAGLRGAMLAGDPSPAGGFFDTDAAVALYRDLLGPVEPQLAGRAHLLIVPPPDLLGLPFAALATGQAEDGRPDWLIRRHAVSVLPSVASLGTLRGRAAPQGPLRRMVGIGDPVIGRAGAAADCATPRRGTLRAAPPSGQVFAEIRSAAGLPLADPGVLSRLPRLPDTVCELQAIGAGFPPGRSHLVLGAAATETAIRALEAEGTLSQADVLVFATHGLTAGEAGAAHPGLVLTPPARATATDDGLLTAAEIAAMTLDLRLVVLSACNSAAGDGAGQDGLSGLARAFFQSGAQSLMVTHWSVYSEAAVDVSTGFFAALRADPSLRHAEALRAAMLDLLDDGTRPALHHHPSYWAAFTMVGAS